MDYAAASPAPSGKLLENRILQMMQKGDKQYLDLLYQQYGGIMFKITIGITKSHQAAEDVLQESLVKIWKNAHRFDASKAKLLTWVVQIAKNTALDFVRSKAARNNKVTDTMADKPVMAEYGVTEQDVDTIGLKETMKQTLESRDKRILEMLYFEGYTQKEVAEQLEMPLGSVKTRVRISVNLLRNSLKN
jgi:RNA polymerase sigma factor (sigma-70 family)